MNIREEEHLRISKKSGRKPISCKCNKCVEQCRSVCLGTPSDILEIAKAGFAKYIKPTSWMVGMLVGNMDKPIEMYQLEYDEETGYCCMFDNGRCKLHDLGLKPIEGKLSSHEIKRDNYTFNRSLSYLTAKTWLDERNNEIIEEIHRLINER